MTSLNLVCLQIKRVLTVIDEGQNTDFSGKMVFDINSCKLYWYRGELKWFPKIYIIYLWCRFHKCMSWLQRTRSLKWYLFFLFKFLTPWVLFIKEIVTFFYVLLLCRLSPRIDSMLSWTCIWGKKMCQSKSLLCFSIGIWTDLMCCHWSYH